MNTFFRNWKKDATVFLLALSSALGIHRCNVGDCKNKKGDQIVGCVR